MAASINFAIALFSAIRGTYPHLGHLEPNGGGDQREFAGTLFLTLSKGATNMQKIKVLKSIEFPRLRYYIGTPAPDSEI